MATTDTSQHDTPLELSMEQRLNAKLFQGMLESLSDSASQFHQSIDVVLSTFEPHPRPNYRQRSEARNAAKLATHIADSPLTTISYELLIGTVEVPDDRLKYKLVVFHLEGELDLSYGLLGTTYGTCEQITPEQLAQYVVPLDVAIAHAKKILELPSTQS